MTLNEISRITRIPLHNLRRLEAGRFEELPADVFVRGFLRSYARCLGLDVDDTVRRYAACGLDPAPVASEHAERLLDIGRSDPDPATAADRANVGPAQPPRVVWDPAATESAEDVLGASGAGAAESDAAASGADGEAEASSGRAASPAEPRDAPSGGARDGEPADDAGASPAAAEGTRRAETAGPDGARRSGGRRRRRRRGRRRRSGQRPGGERATSGAEADAPAAAAGGNGRADERAASGAEADVDAPASAATEAGAGEESAAGRRVLVIDDDCPDEAERPAPRGEDKSDDTLRAFLLPVLSDTDKGSRRGGLTLAVLILVIVATLAMSVLLRRPSDSTDGITRERSGNPGAPMA